MGDQGVLALHATHLNALRISIRVTACHSKPTNPVTATTPCITTTRTPTHRNVKRIIQNVCEFSMIRSQFSCLKRSCVGSDYVRHRSPTASHNIRTAARNARMVLDPFSTSVK